MIRPSNIKIKTLFEIRGKERKIKERGNEKKVNFFLLFGCIKKMKRNYGENGRKRKFFYYVFLIIVWWVLSPIFLNHFPFQNPLSFLFYFPFPSNRNRTINFPFFFPIFPGFQTESKLRLIHIEYIWYYNSRLTIVIILISSYRLLTRITYD